LPQRIEKNFDPSYRKRKQRFHPKMLDEIMFMSEKPDETHFGFLIVISLFREDFPWIYEVGKETYEILKSNKALATKEKALGDFRRLIKHSFRHPIFMEMGGSKDSFMMLEDLVFISDRLLDRLVHVKE